MPNSDSTLNLNHMLTGEKLQGENYDLIFATVDDKTPSPAHERALQVLAEDGSFICLLERILPKTAPEDGRHC